MNAYLVLLSALYCAMSFSGLSCVMNKLDQRPAVIELHPQAKGHELRIQLRHGPHWTNRAQGGPFIFNILPQFSIWAERLDGQFIDTLYVTGALGGPVSNAARERMGEEFWRTCLPAWASRMSRAGKALPGKESPYSDAVSSATPHGDFTLISRLPTEADEVVLYLEINKSGDHNEAFTKEQSDWIGQPSVVYSTELDLRGSTGIHALQAVGYGDASAANAINPDLSGHDTALAIVEAIELELLNVPSSAPSTEPLPAPGSSGSPGHLGQHGDDP